MWHRREVIVHPALLCNRWLLPFLDIDKWTATEKSSGCLWLGRPGMTHDLNSRMLSRFLRTYHIKKLVLAYMGLHWSCRQFLMHIILFREFLLKNNQWLNTSHQLLGREDACYRHKSSVGPWIFPAAHWQGLVLCSLHRSKRTRNWVSISTHQIRFRILHISPLKRYIPAQGESRCRRLSTHERTQVGTVFGNRLSTKQLFLNGDLRKINFQRRDILILPPHLSKGAIQRYIRLPQNSQKRKVGSRCWLGMWYRWVWGLHRRPFFWSLYNPWLNGSCYLCFFSNQDKRQIVFPLSKRSSV